MNVTRNATGERKLLREHGHFLTRIELPSRILSLVQARDWNALDAAIRVETLPGGEVFTELAKHAEFSEIEFILSIRSSRDFPDEDGIWHDDGSRLLAFSLSLSPDPSLIEGGRLELRKRGAEGEILASIPTPNFGTLIIFATGQQGFEHKINRVTQGERIIAAGWCT